MLPSRSMSATDLGLTRSLTPAAPPLNAVAVGPEGVEDSAHRLQFTDDAGLALERDVQQEEAAAARTEQLSARRALCEGAGIEGVGHRPFGDVRVHRLLGGVAGVERTRQVVQVAPEQLLLDLEG